MGINELSIILKGYFNWNKARADCFASMLLALFKVRTINLTELACGMGGRTTLDSRYKRIKRFFRWFEIDFVQVACWIEGCCVSEKERLYLSLDRTNWKWGKRHINILMLSIVHKGIAIPLFWDLLAKAGNSDTQQRIAIIQRFIDTFGKAKIGGLLADREFVGDDWFNWLRQENIPFCIRIKSNHITTNARGLEVNIDALFYDLKAGEQRVLSDKRKLWKQYVYLSALRLSNGKLLIVATNEYQQNAIEHYAKRWEIETLFSCLKTRGFNFEDTHITAPKRIEKILVLLAIAFCWAYKTGEWRHEHKSIKIKKHGRKAVSYFRYGLDILRDIALNGTSPMKKNLHTLLQFLLVKPLTNL